MRFSLASAIAVFLLLAGCGKPAGKAPQLAPAPVEVAVAEQRDMPVELRAIGAVDPLASVQLKAKVQGEVTRVLFSDGAYVKAGQPLFEIDPRSFQVSLQRAEADLEQAQIEATNAKDQADRYTKLTSQGVASKEQFAQFQTAASSQKSILAARQADVDQAKLSLDWATVRAPISGRAGAALLKAGNIVQANTDVLTVINQTQPIYVTFSLPETQLSAVRQWMGKGAVAVVAKDPDKGGVLGNGKLEFLDNTVDRQSGMITMKATFPNENETLWPGEFVDLVVTLTTEPHVVVIPGPAIMEGQDGSQVFVVKDGVATLQKIEIERTVGGNVIVRSGLEPGQTVVVSGQLRVVNGGKVSVTATPGA
ncbi:MAG: efflux RND transporter periplasmic adaptor subunit [Chthoniobacterales bacterium]